MTTVDASDDSSWEPSSDGQSEGSSVEEACAAEDDLNASSFESSGDESIISSDGDLRERVTSLIQGDQCEDHCLQGKAAELQNFLCSIDHMSAREKKESVITALAVLMKTDTAVRRRGTGERMTFAYYLPLIGRVCRDSWCQVYGISTATITRCRRQIQSGAFSVQPHRGRMNLNANKIEIRWLARWFRSFAASLGDVVPVCVRSQEAINGVVKKRYSAEEYTLLPAFFTWDQLYVEMHNYVEESGLDVREPRPSTFRKLLQKTCPTICICSPRSNVCDVCSILYSRMKSGVTAELTEELGTHTAAAKKMRKEYKHDLEAASDDLAVIVMDYSQNLTLPSVTSTPSQWYFLSLLNVYLFGIYYANKGIQYNYVYEESVAGKGTDEVNSLLYHFVQKVVIPNGHRKLSIYADNCGGQNKNNFVLKMLLSLTQIGDLESVDLKFFVKGHTKNAVDRGFGHIRKKFAREDVWTMDQLLEVINSASNSALVHVPKDNTVMRKFRTVVAEAYKDLKNLQSYQLFGMAQARPGEISCRTGPDSKSVVQDLRRSYDGIPTDETKVRALFESYLDRLQPPVPNFEKKHQMFTKVRPYVPEEYADDPIYDAPSAEEEKLANEAKQARRKNAAQKKRNVVAAVEAKSTAAAASADGISEGTNATTSAQECGEASPKSGKQRRKRARKEK